MNGYCLWIFIQTLLQEYGSLYILSGLIIEIAPSEYKIFLVHNVNGLFSE